MTKKLKKLLSMVLVCTMMASLGCAFSVSAEEGFSLSLLADGANIPLGMKAILNAQSLPSDASAIEVYNASGNKVGEAVVSDGAATVECTITDDDNTFTAKAIDAQGAVIAQSNSLEVKGWREKITETRWDIDFSSHTVGAHRWGAPYVQINDSTGNAVTNSGDSLTANTGTANNTIATEDTGDASHGVAMKMVANDEKEVQLNEFYARPSGDIIKFEYDYKIETVPTDREDYAISVMRPVLDGGNWLGELVI
ncbi:MAG: hypothetical protein J6B23_07500, partial [Clostridia bacterium]|nr:hypothetical protein [Clostridia bacterium]